MLLTPAAMGALADPSISASGTPAAPAQGQALTLAMTFTNGGGTESSVTVSADLVRADDTATAEGHFFTAPNPASGQTTGRTATVTVPAGGTASLSMYSGPIANQGAFNPPLSTEDILITVTPPGGTPVVYSVLNAVSVPATPADITLVAVSVGVGG